MGVMTGILRGHWITLKRFVRTFLHSDPLRGGRSDTIHDAGSDDSGTLRDGLFTVQYPEERLPVRERFRVFPVLIYDEDDGHIRCTSCDICARVCPPQCIWIEQATDAQGKGMPIPSQFVVDMDVCMNCGLCAEYCPFDAIKMDHLYALANTERHRSHLFTMEDLLVSSEYYRETHPEAWSSPDEEAERVKQAQKKVKRFTGPATTAAGPSTSPTPGGGS